MNENIISLQNICMQFEEDIILDNLSLDIKKNEFMTILGPSGCGKTTTLRIIGGFEAPTNGSVYFEDKKINNLPPYKRKINTVFQKYSLFSHLNVYENIAFGLRIKKTPEAEIKEKVVNMLKMVNLIGYEKRKVDSLSGGQQQRIAIARALVNEPEVLLLDEPLGALDLKLRKEMQIELKRMQQKLGITFIYVTHDQEEALTMSDTIVVMKDGIIQQMGTAEDIYNEPKNNFVAKFIGESNIVDGIMLADYSVRFAGHIFKCVDKGFGQNEEIEVVIRPEDIVVGDTDCMWKGVVKTVVFKGVHYEMMVEEENRIWQIHSTVMSPEGATIGMKVLPENIHIMKKADSR